MSPLTHDVVTLHTRVRRLEFLLGGAILLALAPWVAIGLVAWKFSDKGLELPKTLSVRALEIRSSDGQVAARLGSSGLDVLTAGGQKLIALGRGAGAGGALRIWGGEREIGYLGVEPQGGGNLTLRDRAGEMVVVASDNESHGGGVALYRGEKTLIGFIGGGVRDAGVVELYNETGRAYGRLCTNESGQAELQLLERQGAISIDLGIDEHREPTVSLFGPESKGGASIQARAEGGSVSLFDPDSRLRAYLGWLSDGGETFKLFGADEELRFLAGEATNELGGLFKVFARGGREILCGGVDDREGSGVLMLHHLEGQRIFAAGMSSDGRGGIINVHDLDGSMILRTPER